MAASRQNHAALQFALPPKDQECLDLPANGRNFAKAERKIENHRHIVTQLRKPLITKILSRDDDDGVAEPRPSGSGPVWEPSGELR